MPTLNPAPLLLLITPDAAIAAWFQHLSHDYHVHWLATASDPTDIATHIAHIAPALILLSTELGGIDSYHLCTGLPPSIQNRPLPVLFLGTLARPCDRDRVFAVGGADYLNAPFSEAEAVARLTMQLRLIAIATLTTPTDDNPHDPLNILPNSHSLTHYLMEQWPLLAQQAVPLSLLLCQIDAFIAYEELYGSQAGQRCFSQVGQHLYSTLAHTPHFLARYRNDQFMIVLPHCLAADATAIARTMTRRIRATHINHPRQAAQPTLTLSIGIATLIPRPTFSHEVIIRAAEAALSEAQSQPDHICLKAFTET